MIFLSIISGWFITLGVILIFNYGAHSGEPNDETNA